MSSIRVRYITIEGDDAEAVSSALRALSLVTSEPEAPRLVARQAAPAADPEPQPRTQPRALPRAPRASASPAAVVARATAAKPAPAASRAPRVANGMAKDVIRQSFASDENYSLTKLAAKLYGAADGRGVQKVKFNIAGLVSAGELVRTGAASYRPSEVKRATDDEDEGGDEGETPDSDDDSEEEEEE